VSIDTYEFAKRWISIGKEITGLPMNGIVDDIKNPFIVLVTLYDFYKVKKNYFSSRFDLVKVVRNLYKGLNKELGKKFNNSRFNSKVVLFRDSLDFAFGYSTYDSLRRILAQNIKNENYMIPDEHIIHTEYDNVISQGLGSAVKNSMSSMTRLFNKLLEHKKFYNLEDPNDLRHYPVFIGVYNHINSLVDTLNNCEIYSSNYREESKKLLMLDIDKVFSKERNKTLELLNTGKIFSSAFKIINDTDDIMYGSSIGESTFTYNKDLFKLIPNNYKLSLKNLKKIHDNDYKKPVQVNYNDMYSNFFG